MRLRLALALSAGALLAGAVPARAQLSYDARRTGMAGATLSRDGELGRFNPAYHAVPARGRQGAKLTIPIPLGLIQALNDSVAFDFDSSYFNPIALVYYILHPPLLYEVKKLPTPTNDVEFTIGQDSLIVDLGSAAQLVPTDRVGFGGTSHLTDIGTTIKGVHVGVVLWVNRELGYELGDTLQRFLREADPARTNTTYGSDGDALAQTGFAPTLGYAGRIAGDSTRGLYVGAAVHYYLGAAYGSARGTVGFVTGDTLLAGSNPVTPTADVEVKYSRFGNRLGHGVGGDVGVVYASGPVEIGFGVNDIGSTLTWPDTRVERDTFDTATNNIHKTLLADHVSSKTRLPVTYIANASLELGTNTTAGVVVLDNERGASIRLGVEQRVGVFALRGGVARDQQKKVQLGWGGGLRFGAFGLDVGFVTHSSSFSTARGITMATSISIY